MLTLRQLEYFTALAQEQHFGRAAQHCHVSQPTLSHQIQLLEERLGTTLIERDRSGLRLTPTGESVLEKARNMLQLRDDIEQAATQEQTDPMATTLTLGVIPTIAPYWLPELLPMVQQAYPQLKLKLYENQTADLLDKLQHGQLDAAILALPIEHDQKLRTTALYEEPFAVTMAPNHPLASSKVIALEDIDPQELLLLEEGHCLRDHALEACKIAQGTALNANVRASSLETLKHLVKAGMGITLLPQKAIDEHDTSLTTRPLTGEACRIIGLIWRTTDPRQHVFRNLEKALKS